MLTGLQETITLNETGSLPMHKDMYFWSARYGYLGIYKHSK